MMKNTNKKNIFLGLLSLGIGLYSLYESKQNKKEINGIKKKSNIEGFYISNYGEQLIITDKDFLISNNNSDTSSTPMATHYKIVYHDELNKIIYLATDRSDEYTGGKYNRSSYVFGETIIENEKIEYFAYYISEYGIKNFTEFKNMEPPSKEKWTWSIKHDMNAIGYQELIEKADKIKKLLT